MSVMMKCGHAANSTTTRDGKTVPACVICAGISPGYDEVDDSPPSLSGRQAKCFYRVMRGGKEHPDSFTVPSSPDLAFFESQPDKEYDSYYCGCHGWD